ncbi:unnamed protein product [Effrenium voratum]|nr:unnamed protein product [Effrenium voratum]
MTCEASGQFNGQQLMFQLSICCSRRPHTHKPKQLKQVRHLRNGHSQKPKAPRRSLQVVSYCVTLKRLAKAKSWKTLGPAVLADGQLLRLSCARCDCDHSNSMACQGNGIARLIAPSWPSTCASWSCKVRCPNAQKKPWDPPDRLGRHLARRRSSGKARTSSPVE